MPNIYVKSKKILKGKIKENKNITKEQWDNYAKENCLFSANTIMFHVNLNNFEKLKQKLS